MLGNYGVSEDTLSYDDETVLVGPNVIVTQAVIEAVHGAVANIQATQHVIEAVHGAVANIDISQLIIEVVCKRSRGRGWGQLIGF